MAAITIREVPDDARGEVVRRIVERKQQTGTMLAASTIVDHLRTSRR